MRPSAITRPTGRADLPLAGSSKVAFESVAELGFKGNQAGVEQFAFRDDDDVEAGRELVATEDLSNQSFSSISLDRAAQFPGSRDSQPAYRQVVRERKQRQIAAVRPNTTIVNLLVFGTPANAFVRTESLRVQKPKVQSPRLGRFNEC
jgi:hypothetical protein